MKIDPRSHVPIYLQIADGIRAAVAAGLYLPGEALPSLRNLAIEVQVNPNTVQRAYDELEREGLVYSRRGKGLFGKSCAEPRAMPIAPTKSSRGYGCGGSWPTAENSLHWQTPTWNNCDRSFRSPTASGSRSWSQSSNSRSSPA